MDIIPIKHKLTLTNEIVSVGLLILKPIELCNKIRFKKMIHVIKAITNNREIIITGFGIAVLYWIIESLVMTIAFRENNFVSQLFAPNMHEVWMRFIVICIIIIFTVIIQSILNRHRRSEEKLSKLGNYLENIVGQRTAELEKVNKKLQNQIDQKVEFTRTLVHELKTPLTPMIGTSEILVEKTKDDEVLQRIAKNINRGAHNLNRRISDLADLAKGEIGTLNINNKPFNLLQTIHDLVDFIMVSAERKNQSLVLDLPQSFPTVWADEERIRQVILNLLDNAIKFTQQNGKIVLRVSANQDCFIIHINDNGCGIGKEDKKHLFDLYWCSDNNEGELSGLGIGLPLSKMLIELHGGQIWVESKKDKGSTFSFSIPMVMSGLPSNN